MLLNDNKRQRQQLIDLQKQEIQNTKTLFEEIERQSADKKRIKDEHDKIIDTVSNFVKILNFQIHEKELDLQDQRSNYISLQEKASLQEQKIKELEFELQRARRAVEDQENTIIAQLKQEAESAKAQVNKLNNELQQHRQNLQYMKKEREQSENNYGKTIQTYTDCINKLQVQLGETKRLLEAVQSERDKLRQQNEDLRKELSSSLQPNVSTATDTRIGLKQQRKPLRHELSSSDTISVYSAPTPVQKKFTFSTPLFNIKKSEGTTLKDIQVSKDNVLNELITPQSKTESAKDSNYQPARNLFGNFKIGGSNDNLFNERLKRK